MPAGEDVAQLLVRCLEAEGVEYVFGIPGEENIRFVDALNASDSIQYVLTRHEQGASFMAEMYGRITGRAGVCSATLGPGAINLLLGTADAQTNSTPVVALAAQGGLDRIHKESHQVIDLPAMFAPVTHWSQEVRSAGAVPEMVRQAFKTAQRERPGAVFLALPEDIEGQVPEPPLAPLPISHVYPEAPSPSQVERAARVLAAAERPVLLAGHGAARSGAGAALIRFAEKLNVPVATTFNAKGVFPDDHAKALGAVGFMRHDYANFGFDEADVLICVGYELQEFDPVKINPKADKKILHLHHFPAEVDARYPVAVGVLGDLSASLDALAAAVDRRYETDCDDIEIRGLLTKELERGRADDSWPVKPQRVVADIREALGREDLALVDTGAGKMWMARLYPTYEPNTCLISNGLSTMGFAVPGAIGAHLAVEGRRRVLAVTGDGAFLMNSQEIETAVRERIPMTVLVLVDDEYGLITWKMELEMGRHSHTRFGNPDLVAYAESFGARGHAVKSADDLLPTLRDALDHDGVDVIACPVDYAENLALTKRLGELEEPI
ncbi:acetolactate synthase large subunit [Streptomyces sp. A7024]|uniref:Acetolactate synthase large subunit n=2 Tax=Streptomyces coryli TaxID=1128680 RepID=A0A6G4U498_9ACTN|nr:acetolactate synthase large subunit [Streptomyces coryli]